MTTRPAASGLDTLLPAFLHDNKDHAVISMDAQGIITAWQGASREIFGYTAAEMLGRPLTGIFTPQDQSRSFDRYELKVAASNGRSEDDRWHVRQDGTRIWATGSVTAIHDSTGTLTGFVKIVQDRTDLRAQIEFLEQQVSALQASRERTHLFIKTLGHELRNPLGPLGNAVLIIQRLADVPGVHAALQIVSRQVSALTRLADDLMDITRMEAGKVDLALQVTDLRRVLTDAVASLETTAADKNIMLDAVLPKAQLLVNIDEGRFQRLVLNLLHNAIKYTPKGGSVWVKATQEGHEIVFRVEDTGMGIAPEVLPRIFELFTREKAAIGAAPGGLGIGLAMVREIAELHGGSVQARSGGTGKGSEFIVRMPAHTAGEQA